MKSSSIIAHSNAFIDTHNLISPHDCIIIGLSGGPDSVFLLHLLAQRQKKDNLTLIAAHLDHGWRPESAHDALFCKKIAHQYAIEYVSMHAQDIPVDHKKYKGSQEALGRALRRAFFAQVQKKFSANRIALGHHLDDQEETFFIRLIRGATISGLAGMRPEHHGYIRPLLNTKKNDIITYLHEHGIDYLTDPTNTSMLFLRNKIRTNIIPAIRAVDPRFDHHMARTIAHIQETDTFLAQQAEELFGAISNHDTDHLQINIPQLLAIHPLMQHRILMLWLVKERVPFTPTRALLDEIIRYFKTGTQPKHTLYDQWHIVRSRNQAYIIKKS